MSTVIISLLLNGIVEEKLLLLQRDGRGRRPRCPGRALTTVILPERLSQPLSLRESAQYHTPRRQEDRTSSERQASYDQCFPEGGSGRDRFSMGRSGAGIFPSGHRSPLPRSSPLRDHFQPFQRRASD